MKNMTVNNSRNIHIPIAKAIGNKYKRQPNLFFSSERKRVLSIYIFSFGLGPKLKGGLKIEDESV